MCACGTVAGLSVTHTIIALLRVYSQCLHEHSAYVVGKGDHNLSSWNSRLFQPCAFGPHTRAEADPS